MAELFKASVKDRLDRMKDPEKMVKRIFIKMEEGPAKVMAGEKNLLQQQAVPEEKPEKD